MAPRPNSGLESHEKDILGDSPLSDRLFHQKNESSLLDDLDREEESNEAGSIFIGLLMALSLAILIFVISAFIYRKLRARHAVLLDTQMTKQSRDLRVDSSKQSPSSEPPSTSPLDRHRHQLQQQLRRSSNASTSSSSNNNKSINNNSSTNSTVKSVDSSKVTVGFDNSVATVSKQSDSNERRASTISVESLSQLVRIPPNKGMALWRGRARILLRHAKRHLLKREVAIHGCVLPRHCRQQLKRIYVY